MLRIFKIIFSPGEENPGMVKISRPPVDPATNVGKPAVSLALGVTDGETAPDWSAWEAS